MIAIDQSFFYNHLQKRDVSGNKYSFGNVLIYGGSTGKWGASILACKSALRSGSGLVTALLDESLQSVFLECIPEVMHLYQFELENILKFDAIGVGSGLGLSDTSINHVHELLQNFNKPMVLDADALNILSYHPSYYAHLKPYHVLTPHFGEASRLFGKKVTENNVTELGLSFVSNYPCTLVLKGPKTKVIAANGEVFINTTGNDGLATAGSGDVLTGIITSFLGKGYEPSIAACLGVFVHGLMADHCNTHQSKSSMIATDLIEALKNIEI
ncbi:MAG: hypothetical protein RJA76_350 [Bacteroidota bacterium]|jgi:NAD(P)H-hydrate epimerase